MEKQDNIITKILLIVLIAIAIYLIIRTTKKHYIKNNECFVPNNDTKEKNTNNELFLEQQPQQSYKKEQFVENVKVPDNISLGSLSLISGENKTDIENKSELSIIAHDSSPEATQAEVDYKPDIEKKLKNKNQPTNGEYKRASYDKMQRGYEEATDWKQEFNNNQSNPRDNNKFIPLEEDNNFHPFTEETTQKEKKTTEDLFDTSKLLPSETRSDWFEVMPDPISVKNRHLINTSRHIAVNTIGSSLRNPTYDLRPAPPNPKFVPGPWNQTTIEPDINGRPIF